MVYAVRRPLKDPMTASHSTRIDMSDSDDKRGPGRPKAHEDGVGITFYVERVTRDRLGNALKHGERSKLLEAFVEAFLEQPERVQRYLVEEGNLSSALGTISHTLATLGVLDE